MVESLTNLKNNKIKPSGDGAVDNYSGLKKYLSGLKKKGPRALAFPLRYPLTMYPLQAHPPMRFA